MTKVRKYIVAGAGVGKTKYISEFLGEKDGIFLIICPASLSKIDKKTGISLWAMEAEKWVKGISRRIFVISSHGLKQLSEITTKYEGVIVDEMSMFEQPNSGRTKHLFKYLKKLKPNIFIGMSATPLKKKAVAYYSMYGLFFFDTVKTLSLSALEHMQIDGHLVCSSRLLPNLVKLYSLTPTGTEFFNERINQVIDFLGDSPVLAGKSFKITFESRTGELNMDYIRETLLEEKALLGVGAIMLGFKNLASGKGMGERLTRIKKYIKNSNDPIIFVSLSSHMSKVIETEASAMGKRAEVFSSNRAIDLAKDWNDKAIDVLIIPENSSCFGLNLQMGGHTLIWTGVPYSADNFIQISQRLYRRGQKSDCNVIVLCSFHDRINVIGHILSESKQLHALLQKDLTSPRPTLPTFDIRFKLDECQGTFLNEWDSFCVYHGIHSDLWSFKFE